MILQGTDALSLREVSTSNMLVYKFSKSLPLNRTDFEFQFNLRSKVEEWLVDKDWEFTGTKDWFHRVFTKSKSKWNSAPPPPQHSGKLW